VKKNDLDLTCLGAGGFPVRERSKTWRPSAYCEKKKAEGKRKGKKDCSQEQAGSEKRKKINV